MGFVRTDSRSGFVQLGVFVPPGIDRREERIVREHRQLMSGDHDVGPPAAQQPRALAIALEERAVLVDVILQDLGLCPVVVFGLTRFWKKY